MEAIEDVLWNEELGAWFDYDLQNNSQRLYTTMYIHSLKPCFKTYILLYIYLKLDLVW
jgi:neutral trehalase